MLLCALCVCAATGCVYPIRPVPGAFSENQNVRPPVVFYRPVEIGIRASHDKAFDKPQLVFIYRLGEAVTAALMDVIPLFPCCFHARDILADDEIALLLKSYLNQAYIGQAQVIAKKAKNFPATDIQIEIHLSKCEAGNWSTYYGTTLLGYYLSLGALSGGQNTSTYNFTIKAVDTQTSHVILQRHYKGSQNGWFLPVFAEYFIARHHLPMDLPANAAHEACYDFVKSLDQVLPPSRHYHPKEKSAPVSAFVW
ncbi:MAG: hypothetical protein NTX50_02830 [Candidatus Sumerlaeota bacterium]|nr:hypothetical protein [Candidatus Sumerlaeota bacterium]